MTATISRDGVVPPPEPLAGVIREFGKEGAYITARDELNPWVPFGESAAIKHLAFDVRNNSAANILWVKGGGRIGTHRHRGPVSAITLEGSWGYFEYDWVARPGDFIYELPGTAHTLYCDDPNGMKAMFWLNGAIEFFDDAGQLELTVDVFWFIDHYTAYCRANNLPINRDMFI